MYLAINMFGAGVADVVARCGAGALVLKHARAFRGAGLSELVFARIMWRGSGARSARVALLDLRLLVLLLGLELGLGALALVYCCTVYPYL